MKRRNLGIMIAALVTAAFAFGAFAPAAQASGTKPGTGPTIVDVAIAANKASGEFSILIAALKAADPAVLQTLSGKGQYTVFAPNDAAFASLLKELGVTAEQLLGDRALLTQVLLYHVAAGNLDSEDVLESDRIKTLQGGYLLQSKGVLTDENGRTANIVAVDIMAANGVIHVIDRVVLPKPASVPPTGPVVDDDDDDDNDKGRGEDGKKGHGKHKMRHGEHGVKPYGEDRVKRHGGWDRARHAGEGVKRDVEDGKKERRGEDGNRHREDD
jgi:uncharacterized surface protein with fasciclin (FAS1) repeats